MLLFALVAIVLSSQGALADFDAGQCVLANGTLAVILGPSNIDGQYMARDIRLHQGAGQSFRPDQLEAAPCPGAAVARNVCFPSQEGQAASPLEAVVRHALRTSLERSEYTTTVGIDRLAIGQPRAWTDDEEMQYSIADTSKAIVDARVLYRTCVDEVSDIVINRQERNFACYTAAANGEVVCEITGSTGDLEPQTTERLPK